MGGIRWVRITLRRRLAGRGGRAAVAVLLLWGIVGMRSAGGDPSAALPQKIPEAAERFGEVHWYEQESGG